MQSLTYFISGHIDLEDDEFNQFYKPLLDVALEDPNSKFVMGDAQGADTLSREYLASKIDKKRITIYTVKNPKKVKDPLNQFPIQGSFNNHEEKDKAMTLASDLDIAYVRSSEEQKKRLEARGIQYDPNRKSGTEKNLLRRLEINKN